MCATLFLPSHLSNETKPDPFDFYTHGGKALKRAIRNLLRGDKRKIVIPEGGKRSSGGRWTLVLTPFAKVVKGRWRGRRRGGGGRFSRRVVSIRNLIFFSNFAAIDPHHGLVEIPFAIRLLSLAHTHIYTRIYAHDKPIPPPHTCGRAHST